MTDGGSSLAMLARLSEAVQWDDAVRRHESDPWAYMRRKLEAVEEPLRAYKHQLLMDARRSLLEDLAKPLMPPGSLEAHRETFESLLPAGEFVDLSFHLAPEADRKQRLDGARFILEAAHAPCLFDHEATPLERRSRSWEKRVAEMSKRLRLEPLTRAAERRAEGQGSLPPRARAYLARRLRRTLAEYLAVARADGGVLRDEITPFMLARIEASAAAALRLLRRWR